MTLKRFKVAASTLLLAASTAVVAERHLVEQQCLDFEQVMQLSIQSDPAINTALARLQEAEGELTEARSLYQPQLSAFGRTGSGDVGLVDSVIQNQVGLRVSQRLIDFGDAKYARRAADANVKASNSDIIQARLQAAQESGLAVLAMTNARQQLDATRERQDYFKRQLSSIDRLLESGGATRFERAEVAAELADAEALSLELQFDLEQAVARLGIYTDIDTAICQHAGSDNYLQQKMSAIPNSQQAVIMAIAQSPVIKALQHRADSLKAERDREKLNQLPIVDLVGISSYTSTGSADNFELQERIGLDVSVPLYSGRALSARKQQASAREAAARSELADAKRQIREQTSILFRRISSLERQLHSRQRVEQQSKLQLEAAEMEYRAGTRTLPDLVEVRLDFENATLRFIETGFQLQQQRLQLLSLTAQLVL